MEVSWQVYAERNDIFLQKRPESRLDVREKPDREKGRYQHPQDYGQPKEKATFFLPNEGNRADQPVLDRYKK